ncbi:MAG: tetratricopeptide repeat protein [Candidatus Aegiribacteria sp.]|nr:tetratricopeptide repeat protein [Candidatus Aegiribacteria sp.]
MKRVLFPVLLIFVSVTWCQIEYQPITGELLEHWNTVPPSHFPKVYDFDSGNLPDGIYELCIAGIEVERDSLDIYLLGIASDADIPFLLATGGYRGNHNFTKSFARYDEEEDQIYLSFQMPFSARYCKGCYRWDIEDESLVLIRYIDGDPSLEAVERADNLMAEGSIAEAIRELNEMFYPHNYYSSDEMIARLLRSINRAAGDAEVEGNYVEAVSLFGDLAGFLHTDREWFTAFTDSLDYVNCDLSEYMGLGEYVMIMNNYAYYLELTDDLDNSLIVLRKVLDLKPNRMVAHLNIADVLWGLGEPAEAEDHYSIYLRMMIGRELTHQIPVRVYERIARYISYSSPSWVFETPEMAVGQWIEYGVNNLSETLTISVVSSEINQGTKCYWVQISFKDFVGQILVNPGSMETAMKSYEQQFIAFAADPEAYIRGNMSDTGSLANFYFNEENMDMAFEFISAIRILKFEHQGMIMAIDLAGVPEILEELMSDSSIKERLQQDFTRTFNADGGQESLDIIIAELENMQFDMTETDVNVAGTRINSMEFSIVHHEGEVEIVLSSELPLIPLAFAEATGSEETGFVEVRGYGFSGAENFLPGEPAQIIQGVLFLQGMQ